MVDGAGLLREPFPSHLGERLVAEAEAIGETPVALYVVDLDGHCLWRLTGSDVFPDTITVRAVGPELPDFALPALLALVESKLPGGTAVPLRVRDRSIAVLVTAAEPAAPLEHLADEAGLALELASGYTDVVHAARRRKSLSPAAEIQQSLLPPRIARLHGASVAGGVLPAYDVGGDFFDYAGNADGIWLTVADAMGKGSRAAALASLALGALRSVRRRDGALEEAVHVMHEAVSDVSDGESFVTTVIAHWRPSDGTLSWISCGHLAPLMVAADGSVEELTGVRSHPLGLEEEPRGALRNRAALLPGSQLVLYSDGLTERRRDDGSLVGVDGIRAALATSPRTSAAQTVRDLQDAVLAASHRPLRDDATLLVVAPTSPA